MNYHNVLCLGDSLTFGARTYGCYPLYLAMKLTKLSPYEWRAINFGVNGFTIRDLWLRLNVEIDSVQDCYLACVLIGTNDVSNGSEIHLFEEYYRQLLRALFIKKYKAVLCGEILPIFPDGHVFFKKETIEIRLRFNQAIENVVDEYSQAKFVSFKGVDRTCYEDSVHFNEKANEIVADAFCQSILDL